MGKYEDEKYDFDDYEEVFYEDENGETKESININSEDEMYEDYSDSEEIANKIDSDMLENEILAPEAESLINNFAKRWSDLNLEVKAGNGNPSKVKEMLELSENIISKVFSQIGRAHV